MMDESNMADGPEFETLLVNKSKELVFKDCVGKYDFNLRDYIIHFFFFK